jgi:hypothetical protein
LQRASPLDVLMVPSSSITIAADGECLTCGGFSLSKTIHFGSLEFLIDRLGGMSLSPMGDGSDVVAMGSAHGGPLLPQWTMMGDSAEGFSTAPVGEGRTDLPSPRRHDTRAMPASTTTIPRPENPLANQATTTIPPW